MERLDALRDTLPQSAADLRLNIQSVLRPESLTADQAFAIAYASALFVNADSRLIDALREDGAEANVSDSLLDDAHAAVAIMGMNTVYYRFRHMVGKDEYANMPPKLRMQRIGKPKSNKINFELLSMACAALAGCEMCIHAHEQSLLEQGATQSQVHDSVRIASVIAGFNAALRVPAVEG